MKEKHQCQGHVSDSRMSWSCTRNGVVQDDKGNWYCKTHAIHYGVSMPETEQRVYYIVEPNEYADRLEKAWVTDETASTFLVKKQESLIGHIWFNLQGKTRTDRLQVFTDLTAALEWMLNRQNNKIARIEQNLIKEKEVAQKLLTAIEIRKGKED
jgi:hypothetical protein